MSNKEPEDRNGILELIKKLWSPIAGFLGAVTLVYSFYQLWLGDQTTITYIITGASLALTVIVMVWVAFGKETTITKAPWPPGTFLRSVDYSFPLQYRRFASGGLGIMTLLAVFAIIFLIQHRQNQERYLAEQEQKLIIVIAAFEGPEDVYGLRNEIIENLNTEFSKDEDIVILPLEEVVTVSKGSEYARSLGENHLADIVIWGWYRPTENPNINIHIENLSPSQLLPLKESDAFQPTTTISELESFSFQQKVGNETRALISFLAGVIEYESENYETAIQYFDASLETMLASPYYNQAIQINPQYAEAYINRGIAYVKLGEYERAIQDYDQAIQINPQFAEAYIIRGFVYVELGEYERAIQDYDQAIKINPQFAEAYIVRGNAYGFLGEDERAIQDYGQAIQINPQDAKAYFYRGLVYYYLGIRTKIQDYDQAYQNYPQYANVYLSGEALDYLLSGKHELAIQDYDQAIQINPQFAEAYYFRGLAYAHADEYTRAIQDYDQAIRINPQDADAYRSRGFAYLRLGKHQRAIQDYDQAIQINPQDVEAYYGRGLVYVILENDERAIQDYDQAIQINPHDEEGYVNRGFAYYLLGHYERAILDFDQAIQLNTQDTTAYFWRGESYNLLGKTAEAEADFAKFEELIRQDAP